MTHEEAESSDAPYFVDLVNDRRCRAAFEDRDFQTTSYRVYTTLDMNLQRDAVDAVRDGIQETDAQWKRRNKKYGTDEISAGPGRAGLSRRGNRRIESAGGRTQLRREPARSRAGQAPAGIVALSRLSTPPRSPPRSPGGRQRITPATIIDR